MPANSRRSKQQSTYSDQRGDAWRLFLAVPLPGAVRDLLGNLVSSLSSTELPIRWVNPNSAHLTMHFLGETPAERAELLRYSFGASKLESKPVQLQTSGFGIFPDERRPRVIWLGLRGQTDLLAKLQRETGDLLRRLDFDVDDRELKPHLTLGRVRDNPPADFPKQLQSALHDNYISDLTGNPVRFRVEVVHLYRSFLERTGARYEIISTAHLAKSGASNRRSG